MKNLKDNLSTIVAVLLVICGFIILLSTNGLAIPSWLIVVCASAPTFLNAIVAIFQGKNSDLSTKTKKQLNQTALQK